MTIFSLIFLCVIPEMIQESPIRTRQSPGNEIVEEGGSIAEIQPPSSTTHSRELSLRPNGQLLNHFGYTELLVTPPSDWEQVSSPDVSPHTQAAWVKKVTSRFRPSLNLTTEPVSVSLDEYVQAVRKLHQKNSQVRWRPLGKLETAAGIGELTELDIPTQWGAVRMLQLLLVRDNCAYIVTGAALKEEFSNYQRSFRDIFKKIQPISEI